MARSSQRPGNGRFLAGAIGGSLLAGAGITVMLMWGERRSGRPSEIVTLQRKAATKLGIATPPGDALPTRGEQAFAQSGHLLLSALAGATYAALVEEDTPALPAGLAFGAAFYAAMHWIAGPAFGVKAPEWRSDPATIEAHAANHLLFGVITALAASAAVRTPSSA